MKKLLIFLLVLLCMVPAALVEEDCPLEFRMELSQNQFVEPGEVTVTISVTNASDVDMPGPLTMYWPDGRMVNEFGMPTLLAGESCNWQGTWNVTTEQLNAGKLVFAVMYTCQMEDGTLTRRTQPFYSMIAWEKKPSHMAEIVLKGNPTTGYSWDWQGLSGDSCIKISCETAEVNNVPGLVGRPMKYTYVLEGTQPGYVELCFTYARSWEHDCAMALYHLHYDVHVDEELNVSILKTRFDW